MSKVSCPELCPGCPLRPYTLDEPRFLQEVGQKTLAATSYEEGTGGSVSIGIEYGAGPTLTEVAIMSEGATSGPAFWVKQRIGLSIVRQAFESCKQPTELRSGFLKRKKQVSCGALFKLKEK